MDRVREVDRVARGSSVQDDSRVVSAFPSERASERTDPVAAMDLRLVDKFTYILVLSS